MLAIHDRIILEPILETTQTASGILLPLAGNSKVARVVSVGRGKLLDNGTYRKPDLKEGDTVLVNQFFELQNEDWVFLVTTEAEILGVVFDLLHLAIHIAYLWCP